MNELEMHELEIKPEPLTRAYLGELATNFRNDKEAPKLKDYLKPYGCDGIIDPLTLWGQEYLIQDREIRQLMFLLDWRPSSEVGKNRESLKQSLQYCQTCWDNEPSLIPEDDRSSTFSFMMWSPWSRALLQAGHCLPVNVLWGIRTFTGNNEVSHLLLSARDYIIQPLITRTQAKTIYCCHAQMREAFKYLKLPTGATVTHLYHPATGYDWLRRKLVPRNQIP
jgi:hypothetical protein